MAITLISKDETYYCTVLGVRFSYRRIAMAEQRKIEADHTKRGQVDHRAVGYEMVRRGLRGWDHHVTDAEGKAVAFSPDKVDMLPEEVVLELMGHLQKSDPREDLLGNSEFGSTHRYEITA